MRHPIPHPEFPSDLDLPGPRPAASRGTGTRLWLVRHAEVHADFENTAYGDSDVPLSALGEEQTRALGRHFAHVPLAIVLASPLARARAMGGAIAEHARAAIEIHAGLKEVSRGAWQGLPIADFRARWLADREAFLRDPWHWKGHGGESDAELFARGWPVVERALESAAGGTAVLASHYNLIRALVTGALGLDPRESFAFRNRPAHAALLVDAPGGWRLDARDVADPALAPAR
ncbi:MAG: histidine phosphatase family protein [Planctomycetota bacterium]|nr:histidine phosphatase family protein [Planctomycetota bacterium]